MLQKMDGCLKLCIQVDASGSSRPRVCYVISKVLINQQWWCITICRKINSSVNLLM